jgi:hypothetical protein
MDTYCVILRPQQSWNRFRQEKRYYLRARSAAQAMFIALEDSEWVVCGVEPAGMSAPTLKSEPRSVPGNFLAARASRLANAGQDRFASGQ